MGASEGKEGAGAGGMPKRRSRFSEELAYIGWGLGGLSVGAIVLTCGQIGERKSWASVELTRALSFIDSSAFEAWLFLMSALTAVCAMLFLPLRRQLRQVRRITTASWLELGIGLLALLLPVVVLQLVLQTTSPMRYHTARIYILIVPGLVVGAGCLAGILMSGAAAKRDIRERPLRRQVAYMERVQKHLKFFLIVAGAIVGLGTLARGALRHALLAADLPTTNLDKNEIIVYGLYLSMILAIAYVPARIAIRTGSQRILDEHFPMPSDPKKLRDWSTQHKIVSGVLQVDVSLKEEFESGVAILAPLAGSATSLLLGK